MEEGENVDVIDFAKAFDKVVHGILLHKLKDIGITGKFGQWLHNWKVTISSCEWSIH